jgi:hypothetical protein
MKHKISNHDPSLGFTLQACLRDLRGYLNASLAARAWPAAAWAFSPSREASYLSGSLKNADLR